MRQAIHDTLTDAGIPYVAEFLQHRHALLKLRADVDRLLGDRSTSPASTRGSGGLSQADEFAALGAAMSARVGPDWLQRAPLALVLLHGLTAGEDDPIGEILRVGSAEAYMLSNILDNDEVVAGEDDRTIAYAHARRLEVVRELRRREREGARHDAAQLGGAQVPPNASPPAPADEPEIDTSAAPLIAHAERVIRSYAEALAVRNAPYSDAGPMPRGAAFDLDIARTYLDRAAKMPDADRERIRAARAHARRLAAETPIEDEPGGAS